MIYRILVERIGERPANQLAALFYVLLIALIIFYLPSVDESFRYMNW